MRLATSLTVLSLMLQAACTIKTPPCSDQVDKGDTLEVEIVERWDEDSAFAFDPAYLNPDMPAVCRRDDVKPGQKFTLRLKDEVVNLKCTDPLCPVDFPTESEPDEPNASPGRDELCLRTDRVVRETSTCRISRYVSLHRENRQVDMFSDLQMGEIPPVVLTLQYSGSEDSANAPCDDPESVFPPGSQNPAGVFVCTDNWVVRVKKR